MLIILALAKVILEWRESDIDLRTLVLVPQVMSLKLPSKMTNSIAIQAADWPDEQKLRYGHCLKIGISGV